MREYLENIKTLQITGLSQYALSEIMSYLYPKEIFQIRRVSHFFNNVSTSSNFLKFKLYIDFIQYFGYSLSIAELSKIEVTKEHYKAAVIVFTRQEQNYYEAIRLLTDIKNKVKEVPEFIFYLLIKLTVLIKQRRRGYNLIIDDTKILEIRYYIAELESRQPKQNRTDSHIKNIIEIEALKQQFNLLIRDPFDNQTICQLVIDHLSAKDKTFSLSPQDTYNFTTYIQNHHGNESFLDLLPYGSVYRIMVPFYKRLAKTKFPLPLSILFLLSHPVLEEMPIGFLLEATTYFEDVINIEKDLYLLRSKFVPLLKHLSEASFPRFIDPRCKPQLLAPAFIKKENLRTLAIMSSIDEYYEIQKRFTADFNLVTFTKLYSTLSRAITSLRQIVRLLNCSTQRLQRLENLLNKNSLDLIKIHIILLNADNKIMEILNDNEFVSYSIPVLNNIFSLPDSCINEVIDSLRILAKNDSVKITVPMIRSLVTYFGQSNQEPIESKGDSHYKRKLATVEFKIDKQIEKRMRIEQKIRELEEELENKSSCSFSNSR